MIESILIGVGIYLLIGALVALGYILYQGELRVDDLAGIAIFLPFWLIMLPIYLWEEVNDYLRGNGNKVLWKRKSKLDTKK